MVKYKIIDWFPDEKLYDKSVILARYNRDKPEAFAECNIIDNTFILYNLIVYGNKLLTLFSDFIKHFDYIKKIYIINEKNNRSEKVLKRWNFNIINEYKEFRLWLRII